jgi:DNA (cytosine-5)-methyltransferase 1
MAVSLFSGCGGDTLGLERAGLKVLAFSEINNTFSSSHLSNFPDSLRILPGDITKIEDTEFQKYKNLIDILFAGFPCQGFSRAGKKDPDDPRNRLYLQFVRAVGNIRPRFFLGENVKGLETMRSGPEADDPLIIDLIRQEFAAIGYSMIAKTWEATDFGVPQKRKRVILVGWDTTRVPNFPVDFWERLSRSAVMPTLRSFVSNSMEGAYRIPEQSIPDNFANYALEIADDAVSVGKSHPYVVLKTDQRLLSCTKRDSPVHSEIIDLDAPSKTIICTYAHQPRLLVGLRKRNGESYVRTLFPDELKQIQGFPADYIINGNLKDQITQIGNAAPPSMIECVARALLSIPH